MIHYLIGWGVDYIHGTRRDRAAVQVAVDYYRSLFGDKVRFTIWED